MAETQRNADSAGESRDEPTCSAWVGLEPPCSIGCALPPDHTGPHQGCENGSVLSAGAKEYETVGVVILWSHGANGGLTDG